MGPATAVRQSSIPLTGARVETRRHRFEEYFSRLFAYTLVVTGDEESAKDLTATAFAQAFAQAFALPGIRESEFELEIFRLARKRALRQEARSHRADGLSARERDVISLIFDAQLDREQIGQLLGVKTETVVSTLFRGLRKLKATQSPATVGIPLPSFS